MRLVVTVAGLHFPSLSVSVLSVSVAEQRLGQVEEPRVISMARIGGSQVISGVFRAEREPLSASRSFIRECSSVGSCPSA